MSKVNKSEIIRKMFDQGKTAKEIRQKTKFSYELVRVVIRNHKRKKPSKIVESVKQMKQALDVIEKPKVTRKELLNELMPGLNACFGLDKPVDMVNKPPHYTGGGIETIDFIEAKDLNYRLGNVVKYVSRAGKKVGSNPVQDLEKALFYLNREIAARTSRHTQIIDGPIIRTSGVVAQCSGRRVVRKVQVEAVGAVT